MSYEGLDWRVCQKGHYEYKDCQEEWPAGWRCRQCRTYGIYAEGAIDQTNGDDSPEAMDGWGKLGDARERAYDDWLAKHPDEQEVVMFQEGMIVSHKEKGGIGVVCTRPPCEWEPAEKYVSWVFKPSEVVSIWLSGRERHFIRRSPM